jgi:hypothetical protein
MVMLFGDAYPDVDWFEHTKITVTRKIKAL